MYVDKLSTVARQGKSSPFVTGSRSLPSLSVDGVKQLSLDVPGKDRQHEYVSYSIQRQLPQCDLLFLHHNEAFAGTANGRSDEVRSF